MPRANRLFLSGRTPGATAVSYDSGFGDEIDALRAGSSIFIGLILGISLACADPTPLKSRRSFFMRAAIFLSLFIVLCGILSAFGYPAVQFEGEVVTGFYGLSIALTFAIIPPLIVWGFRVLKGIKSASNKDNEKY